jgi:hypothetical protein
MKPTREWDGWLGWIYWRIRRGKPHEHFTTEHPGYMLDAITHAHHFPHLPHADWPKP